MVILAVTAAGQLIGSNLKMSLSIPRQAVYYVKKVSEGRSVSNVQVVSPCEKQG